MLKTAKERKRKVSQQENLSTMGKSENKEFTQRLEIREASNK